MNSSAYEQFAGRKLVVNWENLQMFNNSSVGDISTEIFCVGIDACLNDPHTGKIIDIS